MKFSCTAFIGLFLLVFSMTFLPKAQAGVMEKIWTPAPVAIVDRDYDYYPDQRVFYDPVDKIYYFLDGRIWKSGYRGVPDWITLGRKVTVNIKAPKPYYKYDEVRAQYPPPSKS